MPTTSVRRRATRTRTLGAHFLASRAAPRATRLRAAHAHSARAIFLPIPTRTGCAYMPTAFARGRATRCAALLPCGTWHALFAVPHFARFHVPALLPSVARLLTLLGRAYASSALSFWTAFTHSLHFCTHVAPSSFVFLFYLLPPPFSHAWDKSTSYVILLSGFFYLVLLLLLFLALISSHLFFRLPPG